MEDPPELSSDEDEFPEGDMFPLNSRRIKGCWIHRIVEALELPDRAYASLAEMRQMIEGKLMELQYKPQNVQVIAQGKNYGAAMFLVNETGVIKCIESCDESAHKTVMQGSTISRNGPDQTRPNSHTILQNGPDKLDVL